MDSTAELAIITFLGDTEPWRIKVWCEAIEQLDTPMDTFIVVVDNTAGGVGELHLPQPHTVVRYEPSLPEDGIPRYKHFDHLWRIGMEAAKGADYVMMLDSDIVPSVSYATMKSNLSNLGPKVGVVALKARARRVARVEGGWGGHNLSAWRLNAIEPYSYGPEWIEPDEAVEVGRVSTCCLLFLGDALSCYNPRILIDVEFGSPVQENALYHDMWANGWSVWLLGQLPWCKHYIDATHYVQDTPEVIEE